MLVPFRRLPERAIEHVPCGGIGYGRKCLLPDQILKAINRWVLKRHQPRHGSFLDLWGGATVHVADGPAWNGTTTATSALSIRGGAARSVHGVFRIHGVALQNRAAGGVLLGLVRFRCNTVRIDGLGRAVLQM